jgi:hypothetical protein
VLCCVVLCCVVLCCVVLCCVVCCHTHSEAHSYSLARRKCKCWRSRATGACLS